MTSITTPQPRLLAFMNQKGGVGKTTTSVNLAAALALRGKRVLCIDLDPQAHLTLHLGLNPDELEHSVYSLLTDHTMSPLQVIYEVGDNLSLLPAEVNLAGVESELAALAAEGKAQHLLRDKLQPVIQGLTLPATQSAIPSPTDTGASTSSTTPAAQPLFDFVVIDCPPSLGLLTVNALALANEVMVPMQAHFLALQGLSKLLSTVGMVRQAVNPSLEVTGIIVGLYDGQTALAREVMQDLKNFLEAARNMDVPWRRAEVLSPPIRRNIKLAECPSFGQTIFDYAPLCPGAQDYRTLAQSVLDMNLNI